MRDEPTVAVLCPPLMDITCVVLVAGLAVRTGLIVIVPVRQLAAGGDQHQGAYERRAIHSFH